MLTDDERFELLRKASEEIKATCKKYNVVLTVSDGEPWLHHGDWHESGDYSVREKKLDKDCCL